MTGLVLEKVLPLLTVRTVFWAGLAVLVVILGLLFWTRLGEGPVLGKCLAVSLGIHLLLLLLVGTLHVLPRVRSNLIQIGSGLGPPAAKTTRPGREIQVPISPGSIASVPAAPGKVREFGVSSGTGLVEKPGAAPEVPRETAGPRRPEMPRVPAAAPSPRVEPKLPKDRAPNQPLDQVPPELARPAPKPVDRQLARLDNPATPFAPRSGAAASGAKLTEPAAGGRRNLAVRPTARPDERRSPAERVNAPAGAPPPPELLPAPRPDVRAPALGNLELARHPAAPAPLVGPSAAQQGPKTGAASLAVVQPSDRPLYRRPSGSAEGTDLVRRAAGGPVAPPAAPHPAAALAGIAPPAPEEQPEVRVATGSRQDHGPAAGPAAPAPGPAPVPLPPATAAVPGGAGDEEALRVERPGLLARRSPFGRSNEPLARPQGESAAGLANALAAPPPSAMAAAPLPAPVPQVRPGRYTGIAPMYLGRIGSNRKQRAQMLGATRASEQAVELALRWLEEHQDTDGKWSAAGFSAHCPPPGPPCSGPGLYWDSDTGTTGLALLAYLGAGYTQRDGHYLRTVRTGLDWLIAAQKPDGDLRGQSRNVGMYCHGIAALALTEAYAMTGDPKLRDPVRRAIQFIASAQNPDSGGWRYYPYGDWDAAWARMSPDEKADPRIRNLMTVPRERLGDSSVFGWLVMALKSAASSGFEIPQPVWDGAAHWIARVSTGPAGGLAKYQPWDPEPRPSMTAEILLCREFLNTGRSIPAQDEAARYILDHPPDSGPEDIYYWYYATMALFQRGGADWHAWNGMLRDDLVRRQRRAGHQAGSWDPDDRYGKYGGRIYQTALSTLSLEVYYRYLRLYGSEDEGNEPTGE